MRLFLGLTVPEEIKQHIHNSIAHLKQSDKGWENPHDYHQTLLFIGEATIDEYQEISMRLESLKCDPFMLTLSEIKFFNRRVMYVSFEPSVELSELKHQVDTLYPEWKKPFDKPFLPHVTIKRWQRYEHQHLAKGLSEKPFQKRSFLVKSICLFKSEKDSENRKYHVVKEVFWSR